MKLLIASDIHGSAYYCEQLLDAYKKENPDKLILLGDILYHGPRNDLPKDYAPKKVIPLLNSIQEKIICVRGNCDAEVDQMVLEFPIMADYKEITVDGKRLFLTHGHVYNDVKFPPVKEGDIVIHGHTHVPRCSEINGVLFLNPGSVSIPKEDSKNGYLVYENKSFIWKDFINGEYKKFSF